MEHNYEESVTLAELWDKLWKHRYLILIITLSITIVLSLGLYFGLKGQIYTSTVFEYEFKGIENNQYPDNTAFRFKDLISYDTLLSVKDSSSLYDEINVEDMYLDPNTTIYRTEAFNSTASDVILTNSEFMLHIPYRYFDYDEELARSFIDDLISSVIITAKDKNNSLEIYNYLDLINDNVEYLDEIDYYSSQYNLLISSMNAFIDTYDGVRIDGVNMAEIRQELQAAYDNYYTFGEVRTLIINESFYKDSVSYISKLEFRISSLEKSILLNELKITELETMYNNLVAGSNLQQADQLLADIADYRIQNVDYQYQIDEYEAVIADATTGELSNVSAEFLTIINDYRALLNEYTTKYNDFYLEILDNHTDVTYEYGSLFNVEGGYSIMLLGAVSGVIGLIVSLVVVFIVESEETKKALESASN